MLLLVVTKEFHLFNRSMWSSPRGALPCAVLVRFLDQMINANKSYSSKREEVQLA